MIVDAVSPVVSPAGFRFKKAAEAFVRKIDGGRQELGLPLVDYNPVFHFSFTLWYWPLRPSKILPTGSLDAFKYHSMTLTSITQLEFFGLAAGPGNRVDFEVSSEPELMAVMPGVLTMVSERVLPFFQEYRDIAAVNRGLNPEVQSVFFASWASLTGEHSMPRISLIAP